MPGPGIEPRLGAELEPGASLSLVLLCGASYQGCSKEIPQDALPQGGVAFCVLVNFAASLKFWIGIGQASMKSPRYGGFH